MKNFSLTFSALFLLVSSNLAHAQFSVQESFNASGYTFSFFSLASTEADQTEIANGENGTGRLSFYNYLTIGQRINYDLKGGIRIPFMYNTAGRDRFNDGQIQDSELFLQDLILFLRDDSIALLPGDIGVFWEGRIYLPTGKFSQRAGQITALRNHFIFNKILNRKFDLEYDQKVTYNHQSRTAYLNRFQDDRDEWVEVASLTKSWEFEHRFNFWYKWDAETGFGAQLTAEDNYFNSSEANGRFDGTPLTKRPEHKLKMGPAARFALNNKINFILTYSDVVNVDKNRNEFGQFKAENTELALLSFVRF